MGYKHKIILEVVYTTKRGTTLSIGCEYYGRKFQARRDYKRICHIIDRQHGPRRWEENYKWTKNNVSSFLTWNSLHMTMSRFSDVRDRKGRHPHHSTGSKTISLYIEGSSKEYPFFSNRKNSEGGISNDLTSTSHYWPHIVGTTRCSILGSLFLTLTFWS